MATPEFTEEQTIDLIERRIDIWALKGSGWAVEFVDDLDGKYGYTNQHTKTIQISREYFPTTERNAKELALHELAHGLCGHGLHNLEWWDQLMDIGGRGVWVFEDGSIQQAKITD